MATKNDQLYRFTANKDQDMAHVNGGEGMRTTTKPGLPRLPNQYTPLDPTLKEGGVLPGQPDNEDDGDDRPGGNGGGGGGGGPAAATPAQAAAQAEALRLGRGDVAVGLPGQFSGPAQQTGAWNPQTGMYEGYSARGVIGNYDPATDAAYQEAMAALRAAQAKLPGYDDSYGDDLAGLYQQITGREPFRYDLDADMLYQQYRQQYMTQGQQAMRDTMGQAAGLTGGYGSTYAQNAGQQAYNAYLQQLNERIPELEERAYQRWQAEGDRLNQQYAMLRDLANDEYGKYRDAMSDYYTNVQLADQQAQQAYGRGVDYWNREASLDNEAQSRAYQEWATNAQANQDAYNRELQSYQLGVARDQDAWDRAVQEYQLGLQGNETAYQRQQDEQARLLQLMQIGYAPTEEDLMAAGMTTDQAAAWQSYIAAQNAPSGGGGGSGSGDGSGGGPVDATPEEWRSYLQEQIALGKINREDYGLYMAAMFPEYRAQQIQQQNPVLTEEEKKKLNAFSGWSAAAGGM